MPLDSVSASSEKECVLQGRKLSPFPVSNFQITFVAASGCFFQQRRHSATFFTVNGVLTGTEGETVSPAGCIWRGAGFKEREL